MSSYNRVVTRYKNGITEVIDYENILEVGYSRVSHHEEKFKSNGRVKLGRIKNKKSDFKHNNLVKNSYRAKKKITSLCNNNCDILDKFITLTFADTFYESDITNANYLFKKFINRLNYSIKKSIENFKLEYLVVPELTKAGAIHYHMLCNLPYVDIKKLQKIWNYGIIYINKIWEIENVAGYISSYVDKDFCFSLSGSKHFFKSSGIKYPTSQKIMSYDDKESYNIDNLTYTSVNYNSYCGDVYTRIYDNNSHWE